MQLQGLRYLISANGRQTGRIEEYDTEFQIYAENLDKKMGYGMFYAIPGETAERLGSFFADDCGRIKETLSKHVAPNRSSGFYTITKDEKIVLYEPIAPIDVIRMDIWNYWAAQRQKKDTVQTVAPSSLLPTVEGDDAASAASYIQDTQRNEEGVRYRECMENRQRVDDLPALQWRAKAEELRRYFEQCKPEPLPLAQGVYWRFVRAPTTAPYAKECLLGRHMENGRISALAYALEESPQTRLQQIPGFRYQKTPDGRGLWIYMEEVEAANL